MQFCLKESIRMKIKMRKIRLFAFSSIFQLQAGVFFQTRRAEAILSLTLLQVLANRAVYGGLAPCQKQNIHRRMDEFNRS
jgi:hypothetical protein